MKMQIRKMLSLMLIAAMAGCSSVHRFDDPELGGLKEGEYATVYETSGRVARIHVAGIDETTVKGRYQHDSPIVEISRDDIDLVEVTRSSPVKSVAAGIGIIIGSSLGGAGLLYLMFL